MGSAASCTSIKTHNSSSHSHHIRCSSSTASSINRQSLRKSLNKSGREKCIGPGDRIHWTKQEQTDSLLASPTPHPFYSSTIHEEEDGKGEDGMEECRMQFQTCDQGCSISRMQEDLITPAEREGLTGSCSSLEGLSIAMETERSARSNNSLRDSRLTGTSSNDVIASLRETSFDICNLSKSLFGEERAFLTSSDRIDADSCFSPEKRSDETQQDSVGQEYTENSTSAVRASSARNSIPERECDSINDSIHSPGKSIDRRDESEESDEASLIVNIRSDSVCTSYQNECDFEELFFPQEDEYEVIEEWELSRYEFQRREEQTRDMDDDASHNMEQHEYTPCSLPHCDLCNIIASCAVNSDPNQLLDENIVTLMDALERLSGMLASKTKQLASKRVCCLQANQNRTPLRRQLEASGVTLRREEHRRRVIVLKEGVRQFWIQGELIRQTCCPDVLRVLQLSSCLFTVSACLCMKRRVSLKDLPQKIAVLCITHVESRS